LLQLHDTDLFHLHICKNTHACHCVVMYVASIYEKDQNVKAICGNGKFAELVLYRLQCGNCSIRVHLDSSCVNEHCYCFELVLSVYMRFLLLCRIPLSNKIINIGVIHGFYFLIDVAKPIATYFLFKFSFCKRAKNSSYINTI